MIYVVVYFVGAIVCGAALSAFTTWHKEPVNINETVTFAFLWPLFVTAMTLFMVVEQTQEVVARRRRK